VLARVTVNGARRPGAGGESERRQRAPTSSYRIGGEDIEEQNVSTLEDLQQLVPGLVIQSTDPSDTQISIRGVGDGGGQASGDSNIGMPSSVAIYVDNVYLARAGMLEQRPGRHRLRGGAERRPGHDVRRQCDRRRGQHPHARAELSRRRPRPAFPTAERLHARPRHAVRAFVREVGGRLNLVYSNNDGGVTNVRSGNHLNGGSSSGAAAQLLYNGGDIQPAPERGLQQHQQHADAGAAVHQRLQRH
jgi:iron complex outermembrane receptor protein